MRTSSKSGWYHRGDPKGILLDTSALRSLSSESLRRISSEHQVYVPWYIIRELFTTGDQAKVPGNLRKLVGLNAVSVDLVGPHLRFELEEGKSSGSLLLHLCGSPEERYKLVIQAAIDFFNSKGADEKQALEDYGKSELEAEAFWKERCVTLDAKVNALPDMQDLRKQFGGRYFETSAGLDKLVRTWLREDLPRVMADLIKTGFPVETVDRSWAYYRFVFAQAWYSILNARDNLNPQQYNHDRLNQRLDLMFVALLHPGLKLLSFDKGMKDLARCLHGPRALYDLPPHNDARPVLRPAGHQDDSVLEPAAESSRGNESGSGGMTEDSPYLSISQEMLHACSEVARKIPSQSPLPPRWLFPDHILWKIGDWEVRRPLRETLLDVVIDHLKYTFGKPWADDQYTLPEEKRHVVMRWWIRVCEAQKKAAPAGHVAGQMFAVPCTGDVTEFGWLADDLYRLRLVGGLDPAVVQRLRSMDQFQGARYELVIAAALVRSGFRIRWIKGTEKHCEFEATHALTKEKIAVEAKSRHVSGTLNRPGQMPNPEEMRFVAHRYYNDALKQCPRDRPCAIFIDLNLPPEAISGDQAVPWWAEMQRMFDALPKPTPTEPALETCLVFTNFAAHYSGTAHAPPRRYVFWFPQYVCHPLRNTETFTGLIRAIETYGRIPVVE